MEQDIQMKMKPGQKKWKEASAKQYISVYPPVFDWSMKLRLADQYCYEKMNRLNTFFFLGLLLTFVSACQSDRQSTVQSATDSTELTAPTESLAYDSLKARAYGADPYGMKKYVFAFLYAGPNRDQDSVRAAELQNAHLQNIMRLAEEGKLVLAGPFLDDGNIRGIYVFNVETIEEAEALTNTDPAIQAGRLKMELKEWYGSAALMGLKDIHESLAKQRIDD